MANIFDVSKYILNTVGDVSTMKLQKLCFYSQALCLVETNMPLFSEGFEAWANGPVSRDLFNLHKGKFVINSGFVPNAHLTGSLTTREIGIINKTLNEFGDKEAHELSGLTHDEAPWLRAREGIPEGMNCRKIISQRSIKEFYTAHWH